MLIHMTTISDLGDALIMHSLEASTISLNIYVNLMIFLIISEKIGRLVS